VSRLNNPAARCTIRPNRLRHHCARQRYRLHPSSESGHVSSCSTLRTSRRPRIDVRAAPHLEFIEQARVLKGEVLECPTGQRRINKLRQSSEIGVLPIHRLGDAAACEQGFHLPLFDDPTHEKSCLNPVPPLGSKCRHANAGSAGPWSVRSGPTVAYCMSTLRE
jgi:hypothetical protein